MCWTLLSLGIAAVAAAACIGEHRTYSNLLTLVIRPCCSRSERQWSIMWFHGSSYGGQVMGAPHNSMTPKEFSPGMQRNTT